MKYAGKEIASLSDDELRDAIHSVETMDGFRFDKLANPLKRHAKLFDKHPPVENPVFTDLVNELNKQFQLRQLKGITNA